MPVISDSYNAKCIMCTAEINVSHSRGLLKSTKRLINMLLWEKPKVLKRVLFKKIVFFACDRVPLTPEEKKNLMKKFYVQLMLLKTITQLIHVLVRISFIGNFFQALT